MTDRSISSGIIIENTRYSAMIPRSESISRALTITVTVADSAVKLTTSYYNPMCGVSYDGIGIQPDVEVALTAEQASRFYLLSHEEDPQLQAALRVLRNPS